MVDDQEKPLLEKTNKKGGFRTLPFIIANGAFEKMAIYGLMSNMILYMMKEYNMEMSTASNVLFFWSASTNFVPLVGAIIADSFACRFHVIGIGSIICLLGMILLWLTTILTQARPTPCDPSAEICTSPTIPQFMFLCASLGLISIGAGAIRSSSLAFGADQLVNGSVVKERYFSWCYASYTFSVLIALTLVVYIQDNMGWGVGFAVPAVLMLLGVISFYSVSSSYVNVKSRTNLITSLSRVVVASFRNRHLKLPVGAESTVYYYKCGGSVLVFPSRNLGFLNKACIVIDPKKDLSPDGKATNPWSLCSIEQVEELKALLKVIPIWSTGMIMSINACQISFPLLQASSVDRRVTSSLTIPAASFNTITVISVIIWIALNDSAFLSVRLCAKKRMGIGIFLSFVAVTVTSFVESIRRGRNGHFGMKMSAMWLVPQYCLAGFAEASNFIAQNEFYLGEFPKSMSSVASTLSGMGGSVASLVASLIMSSVDWLTRVRGNESWVSRDIDKGHYDYYYLVLAGLSLGNMVYFVVCSRAYGPLREERKMDGEENEV